VVVVVVGHVQARPLYRHLGVKTGVARTDIPSLLKVETQREPKNVVFDPFDDTQPFLHNDLHKLQCVA